MPALLSVLQALSAVHPFVALALLPFQFAYQQELKHQDNEKLHLSLFASIKDVMLVSVEMQGVGITMNDKRMTPDGQPVAARLTALGQQMKQDIEGCYNVLDAMQKQSPLVRFCKAYSWNAQLAAWKVTFKTRREDLQFALTLNTAVNIREISDIIHQVITEFASYKTAQERKIEAFFKANGGQDAVLADDTKLAALLKLQDEQTVTHNIQSSYAVASTAGAKWRFLLPAPGGKAEQREKDEVAALRKEMRVDVDAVVQDNMANFSKRLDMSLLMLRHELKRDMHTEGNRVIHYLKGGPHMRLHDKIMRQVWKDQGWKGSAKTHALVFALRDYLVERAERAARDLPLFTPVSASTASVSIAREDDGGEGQDPETAPGAPLPDSWVLDYLQVKHLRNLQQILDPDTSGYSTISEVNAFTQSRHSGWSLPRWISYWAIGWQMSATRFCTEIDEIFNQMTIIREQVGLQMPGNKRYINNYIEETWPVIVGLTSALDRFEGSEWLAEQFKEYLDAQEDIFCSALDKIKYNIDSSEMVHDIVRGEPIERWVFMLIALILRRHLAKMHLCLSVEMGEEELFDDSSTIKFVLEAAWLRYNDVLEFYKYEQTADMKLNFDWFSCGIVEFHANFCYYFAWDDWMYADYYRKNEIVSYSAVSTIQEMKPENLDGILIHEDSIANTVVRVRELKPGDADGHTEDNKQEISDAKSTLRERANNELIVGAQVEDSLADMTSTATQMKPASMSDTVDAISGIWFGFQTTEEGLPSTGMFYLKITASIQDEKTISIQGEGCSFGELPEIGLLYGTATTTPASDGKFEIKFNQQFDAGGEYSCTAFLTPELQILSGWCNSVDTDYTDRRLLAKKTPRDSIMCHRPLLPRPLVARELWAFAYNAVVDDLHRRKPTLKYFAGRFKMIRRCLELLRSHEEPGQSTELSRLQNAFTVGEYMAVRRVAGWYNRASDLSLYPPLYCDVCKETILRSRVVCLDCEFKPGSPDNSVEFNAKEECITVAALPQRDDLRTPHLPTHLLLKARDRLLIMDHVLVKRRAANSAALAEKLCATYVKTNRGGESAVQIQTTSIGITVNASASTDTETISSETPSESTLARSEGAADSPASMTPTGESTKEPEVDIIGGILSKTVKRDEEDKSDHGASAFDSDGEGETITFNCLICHERVSTPCWYCIDCKETDTFVCTACELAVERLYPWDYGQACRLSPPSIPPHTMFSIS
ncbi:hypothetical protein GGX14DRAFT_409643 [Mycena pura]|uniref:Uncharacterized protein n=1 Tax=Mycena pura TaxID=153505 RepID=A0AAD7E5G7_9AGAR|nr:hypothetical protein GGX14DRAFT_409643 [Mycena pura]